CLRRPRDEQAIESIFRQELGDVLYGFEMLDVSPLFERIKFEARIEEDGLVRGGPKQIAADSLVVKQAPRSRLERAERANRRDRRVARVGLKAKEQVPARPGKGEHDGGK